MRLLVNITDHKSNSCNVQYQIEFLFTDCSTKHQMGDCHVAVLSVTHNISPCRLSTTILLSGRWSAIITEVSSQVTPCVFACDYGRFGEPTASPSVYKMPEDVDRYPRMLCACLREGRLTMARREHLIYIALRIPNLVFLFRAK